jgi:hypothetical protein
MGNDASYEEVKLTPGVFEIMRNDTLTCPLESASMASRQGFDMTAPDGTMLQFKRRIMSSRKVKRSLSVFYDTNKYIA